MSSNSRRAMWRVVILVLLQIKISTATAKRLDLERSCHRDCHDTSFANVHDVHAEKLRGGSTILQPPPQLEPARPFLERRPMALKHNRAHPQIEIDSNNKTSTAFLPKFGLEQITMTLLHTSELNRGFLKGVRYWGKRKRMDLASSPPPNAHLQGLSNNQKHCHTHGNLEVNAHPFQTSIEKDSRRSLEDEELTLFHAKAVMSNRSWGPELLPYLKHITNVLEIDDDLVLVLAMVYLDRACSVETRRSNGIARLPFLQPRTVHRLSLSALVLAKTTTLPMGNDALISKLSDSLGMPMGQLKQMIEWMIGALGDESLYVSLEELKAWSSSWESFVS